MRKKILLILLLSYLLSTGFGVKNEAVAVSALSSNLDISKIIEKAKETLKGESGKKEQVFVSFEEYEEDFEYEYEDDYEENLEYWISMVEQGRRTKEKVPESLDGKGEITKAIEVPLEIKEEYNKRQLEKEKGIYYIPQNIYNEYNDFSDAEIIEAVNAKYLELHNDLRKELGLSTFTEDTTLKNIATIRAEEASYFFSHTRPNGEFFGKMIPISREYGGENLACAVTYEPYMEITISYENEITRIGFEGLCNSPAHYAGITNPVYNKIGIDTYIIHYDDGCVAAYTAFEFSS